MAGTGAAALDGYADGLEGQVRHDRRFESCRSRKIMRQLRALWKPDTGQGVVVLAFKLPVANIDLAIKVVDSVIPAANVHIVMLVILQPSIWLLLPNRN